MTASRTKGTLDLSANALTVLERRYLIKDDQGKPTEQSADLFWRVARTIAAPDRQYGASDKAVETLAEAFFELMATRVWMPNSPTLMNAGRPLGQLSACFVLPVDDALSNGKSGIYDTLRAMALVHQSGGGTGFAFSRLRPQNDVVRSTMGVASGPVSFMKLYDASTDVVKQGGTRRGANMGILRVDHPDILEFITCKDDLTQVTNFNISVAITDAFMQAVERGESYDLIHPRTKQVVGQLERARRVPAHRARGVEDGRAGRVLHRPRQRVQPGAGAGRVRGHQPVRRAAAARLRRLQSGIDQRRAVREGRRRRSWDRRLERWPRCTCAPTSSTTSSTRTSTRWTRSTISPSGSAASGSGVMGWADMLVKLGVPYNSEAGVELGEKLMQFVDEESKRASEKLAARARRVPGVGALDLGPGRYLRPGRQGQPHPAERKLRNCNLTTVAPTGTISIIAGCVGDRAAVRGGVHAQPGRRR